MSAGKNSLPNQSGVVENLKIITSFCFTVLIVIPFYFLCLRPLFSLDLSHVLLNLFSLSNL